MIKFTITALALLTLTACDMGDPTFSRQRNRDEFTNRTTDLVVSQSGSIAIVIECESAEIRVDGLIQLMGSGNFEVKVDNRPTTQHYAHNSKTNSYSPMNAEHTKRLVNRLSSGKMLKVRYTNDQTGVSETQTFNLTGFRGVWADFTAKKSGC